MKQQFEINYIAFPDDVTNVGVWSGTPYHIWRAAKKLWPGINVTNVPRSKFKYKRMIWGLKQLLKIKGIRGYYSMPKFSDDFYKEQNNDIVGSNILALTPHFPRASTVHSCGGKICYYIDTTFKKLASTEGYFTLEKSVYEEGIRIESENFQEADKIIGMSRWATKSVIEDYNIPKHKTATVTGGVNFEIPSDFKFKFKPTGAGISRPLIIGFVGVDWERKGLKTLIEIKNDLIKMGRLVELHIVGNMPEYLKNDKTIIYHGFINKKNEINKFIDILSHCDIGCLLSKSEAFGISPLEFLRLGVPIVGYNHQGCLDTHPPNASLTFSIDTCASRMAEEIDSKFIKNESNQKLMQNNACKWSPRLTWDRAMVEINSILENISSNNQLRLWEDH